MEICQEKSSIHADLALKLFRPQFIAFLGFDYWRSNGEKHLFRSLPRNLLCCLTNRLTKPLVHERLCVPLIGAPDIETVASMSPIIGQAVQIKFEKISVECWIIDSRQVWNCLDILVEPVNGRGSFWVSKDRIGAVR